MSSEKHILISRTDSIGDVVLTLPMCAAIREMYPHAKISFLARTYTVPVVRMCEYVDDIINWDEMLRMSPADQISFLQAKNFDTIVHVFPKKEIIWLAKRARIPMRIATGRRWYTLTKCNKLVFFALYINKNKIIQMKNTVIKNNSKAELNKYKSDGRSR